MKKIVGVDFILRRIVSGCAIFLLGIVSANDEWTDTEGRTITAEFIRLHEDTLYLRVNGAETPVSISKLSPESQGYARFLQEELTKWAKSNLASAVLPEGIFLSIGEFSATLLEGKTFLIEGEVAAFGTGRFGEDSALSVVDPSEFAFRLKGGTVGIADFRDDVPNRGKIKVTDDSVDLHLARKISSSGSSGYTFEEALFGIGQPVILKVSVKDGILQPGKIAESGEISAARVSAALNNGASVSTVANLERIRIRIEFLESALSSGDAGSATVSGVRGYAGTVNYQYSEAEMEAMKQELDLLKAELAAASK